MSKKSKSSQKSTPTEACPKPAVIAPTDNRVAVKLMKQAMKHHEAFVKGFNKAKQAALMAGVTLNKAKDFAGHGSWLTLLEDGFKDLPIRTAQRYMEFADEVLAWAAAENPRLSGDNLVPAAMKMVLQSPKGLVALCRDLSLMRQFGEYDAAGYQARKLARAVGEQLEFELTPAMTKTALRVLTPFSVGEFSLSEGYQADDLDALESALAAALKKVREAKSTITVESATEALQTSAGEKGGEQSETCPGCGKMYLKLSAHRCKTPATTEAA